MAKSDERNAHNEQYLDFMDRFLRGEAPTEEQFLQHFAHQNGIPSCALAVGATAADFELADRRGELRRLDDVMGERGLLLTFVRSTYWCPYCRNQLADLNRRVDGAQRSGLAIAAISPDPIARIDEFCVKHDIGYPILSDPTGQAITAYGVRNDDIPPNDLQGHGPLPHPGTFVIAPDRTVLAREFTGDIRHRVSASTLIVELTGEEAGAVRAATPEIEVTASLSAASVFGGQEIGVTVSVRVLDGVHVYGPEVGAPYVPLSISVDSVDKLLADQTYTFPPAQAVRLEALGETLPVLDGEFVVRGRLRLRWSPPRSPFDELADLVQAHAIAPGTYELMASVRFQACSSVSCSPPGCVELPLAIRVEPNTSAGTPVRLGLTEIPPPS